MNTIASGDCEDGYIMVRQPNLLASTCGRVFNYPCHGSIFDRYGVVHAGPAPRLLDSFPISIEAGEVIVDTGTIIQRSGFDESQVTKV